MLKKHPDFRRTPSGRSKAFLHQCIIYGKKRGKRTIFYTDVQEEDSLHLAGTQNWCDALLQLCFSALRAALRDNLKNTFYSTSAECVLSSKSLQIISLYISRFFPHFFHAIALCQGKKTPTLSIMALHRFSSTKKYPVQMLLTNIIFS